MEIIQNRKDNRLKLTQKNLNKISTEFLSNLAKFNKISITLSLSFYEYFHDLAKIFYFILKIFVNTSITFPNAIQLILTIVSALALVKLGGALSLLVVVLLARSSGHILKIMGTQAETVSLKVNCL